MMEKILRALESIKPGLDFRGRVGLVDHGDLDPFDVADLVQELNAAFAIEIPAEEVNPENFASLDTINEMVDALCKAKEAAHAEE